MPGLLDYISGLFGSPQYGPPAPPSTGMLTNPQGIREQALYGALGQLGAGLLAAGARRPVTQPSPLPQALAGFGPAYRQGIQTGQQEAAIERQADQERRWNDIATGTTPIPGIPAEMLPSLRILGPTLGPQVVAQRMTRGTATPMSDADSMRIFGTTGGMLDQNGMPTLPQGPRTQELSSAATTRGRVGVEGFGVQGVGYIPPSAFQPGGGSPMPGGVPRGPVAAAPAGPAPAPAGTGSLVRPGAPPGDPRAGERPWVAEDWNGLGLSREEAQQRADSMNQIQPGITAQAPGVPGAGGPQAARQNPAPYRTVPVPGMPGGQMIMPASQTDTAEATAAAQARVRIANEQIAPQIQGATRVLQGTAELRRIAADPNIRMGPGGGVANMAAEWARFLGATDFANRIQSPDFASLQGLSAGQIVAQMGGSLGAGISNADVALIQRQVPNPLQSRESFERFVNLLEARAANNLVTNHAAYAGSMPGYSPQTDPVTIQTTRQLESIGIVPSILFKDPARGVPRPRYLDEAARNQPTQPPAVAAPAAPTPAGPTVPPTTATANGTPAAMAPGRSGVSPPPVGASVIPARPAGLPTPPPAPPQQPAAPAPNPPRASSYTPAQQQQLISSARGIVNAAPPERREAERARLQGVLRRGGVEWDGR